MKQKHYFYRCSNCKHVYRTTHNELFNTTTFCRNCNQNFTVSYDEELNRPWWKIDWNEISKDKYKNKLLKTSIILFFICVIIYLIFFS